MPVVPVDWLYRRLRRHYPAVFFVLQLSVGTLVAASTLAFVAFGYYDASAGEFFQLLAIAEALTLVGLSWGFVRSVPRLRPIKAWIRGARDHDATLAAWDAAVNLPIRVLKRDAIVPGFVISIPAAVAVVLVLDLSWSALAALLAVCGIASIYAAILQYFAIELGMRPVVDEVAAHLPPDFRFQRQGLPMRVKLITMLPLFSVVTGLVVAALTGNSGSSSLALSVAVAIGVAFTLALELTLLLANSIVRPLSALDNAMEAVQEGHYDVRVPVTTSDEIGELSDGFNRMAAGLAERERLREALGTYIDHEVAEYILSEGATPRGVELDVSVLFCDVRDFTAFAERAEAAEVVASLNRLFEAIVPIVTHHGGHVDKFVGDGLLAVFGAPEPFHDHADRALSAATEIVRVVEDGAAGELRVGVGVNCGPVVAGAIGGGGRLNFSVIGDAVNVAARVEAATRETGDDVLVTGAVRECLTRDVPLVSRGETELVGRDEPIELWALRRAAEEAPHAAAIARPA